MLVNLGTGIGGAMVHRRPALPRPVRHRGGVRPQRSSTTALPCECGNRGCWEQYASGRVLTRRARAAATEGTEHRQAAARRAGGRRRAHRRATVVDCARRAGNEEAVRPGSPTSATGSASASPTSPPRSTRAIFVIGGGVSDAERAAAAARRAGVRRRTLTGRGYRAEARIVRGAPGQRRGTDRRGRPGPAHSTAPSSGQSGLRGPVSGQSARSGRSTATTIEMTTSATTSVGEAQRGAPSPAAAARGAPDDARTRRCSVAAVAGQRRPGRPRGRTGRRPPRARPRVDAPPASSARSRSAAACAADRSKSSRPVRSRSRPSTIRSKSSGRAAVGHDGLLVTRRRAAHAAGAWSAMNCADLSKMNSASWSSVATWKLSLQRRPARLRRRRRPRRMSRRRGLVDDVVVGRAEHQQRLGDRRRGSRGRPSTSAAGRPAPSAACGRSRSRPGPAS